MLKQKSSPKSAGSLITAKVPTAEPQTTIGQLEKTLHKKMAGLETINYVYVINKNRELRGVISIKDIFRQTNRELVGNVMAKNLITARTHTKQSQIALLAVKHNLKAIPIVDKNNRFLGIIPSDAILQTLHNEDIENTLRSAGIHSLKDSATSIIKASAIVHIKKRLPWLFLGLLGGIVAALVVRSFETALEAELMLAAFIPAVVYMADAVGNQVQTLFIRSMALDHQMNLIKYVWREARVNLLIAITLGLTIALIASFWWQAAVLSLTLGLSIFATILIATAVALFLPWFFTKIKLDPAFATGPFATIIRDMTSLLIYFTIAQTLLNLL